MNQHTITIAVCVAILSCGANLAQAVILPLESRLGGLAYYDGNLDITWAMDANIDNRTQTTWDDQMAWASTLNLGGVTGWRLPNADVNGDDTVIGCTMLTSEVVCADNEMGFLFWKEGISNTTPGPFQDVTLVTFWSGTELSTDTDRAWQFFFNVGSQINSLKTANNFAWAVHDGDVTDLITPGDFDADGDVDGDDFLQWQIDPNVGLLSDWETHYATSTVVAANTTVPEPGGAALFTLATLLTFKLKRTQRIREASLVGPKGRQIMA